MPIRSPLPPALLSPALLLIGAALAAGPARAAEEAPRTGVSVSVRAAKARCFPDRVEVTGTLVPREQVDLSADREGLKVAQVLAGPLDTVTTGQILARLVPMEGPSDGAGTPLRAPVGGLVLRSQAAIGQPASPRMGPLFQIVAGGDVELTAEVTLADLGRIAVGQAVAVRPLGLPEVAGKVRRVEAAADPASQTGRVRITLRGAPEARVGTFARGVVAVGERCGIGVPYSAVQYEPDGTIVQVVDGTRIETRQVTVGLLDGDDAEIVSGLSDQDLVVVRAGPFVREGDQVQPIVSEPAPRP